MPPKVTLADIHTIEQKADLPVGIVEQAVQEEGFTAYSLFDEEAQAQIEQKALLEYDRLTDDVMRNVTDYGEPEVAEVNKLNAKLINEIDPVDFQYVNGLTEQLINATAKLKNWDPSRKEVAQQMSKIGIQTRKLFERPKDPYVETLLSAARGDQALILELLKRVSNERKRIYRNAASLEEMYLASDKENIALTYTTAVLERVRVLAVKEMDHLIAAHKKLSMDSTSSDEAGDLAAFIKLVDLKLDGLRGRLMDCARSGPNMRDMRLGMVATATALWNLEQLAVPAMEGTVVQWLIQAQTLEAGHVQKTTANFLQEWSTKSAESSAQNIPAAMSQALQPIYPAEVINKLIELRRQQEDGTLQVFEESSMKWDQASQAMKRLVQAEEAADLVRAEKIDPELVERVGRLSNR